jgi:hypothetical protein
LIRRQNKVLLSPRRETLRLSGDVVLAGNETGRHKSAVIVGRETALILCPDVRNRQRRAWHGRAAQIDNVTDNFGGASLCARR